MNKAQILLIQLFAIISLNCSAQDSIPNTISCINIRYSFDLPAADLAKKFGYFSKAGGAFIRKNNKNIIWGVNFDYIFGSQIKIDSFLVNLRTKNNDLISSSGALQNVGTFQRGYQTGVLLGKVFPYSKNNLNSGLLILTNLGFNEYKVKIFDENNVFAQVKGQYKKGYDRLTNGLYWQNTLGYAYFSKNKNINCYAGLNLNYAFNKGRREWLFDVQQPGNKISNDLSYGALLGWIIPIYKKNVEDTYY
jgi:hypothetical protein